MPDLKISQLTAGSLAQAGDEIPIARSGANYKITGADIAAAATSVGTLSSLTVSGDLTVDTSTLKVDSANNRVGIGTASPSSTLHVASGNIFVDNANGSVIVRNADATNQQQIRVRMSGTDGVLDVTRNSGTVPNLIFGTEGTERARIDASGNLGVGVTPGTRLDVLSGTARWRINNDGAGNVIQECLNSTGASYSDNKFYANTHQLYTSGTERARIDASGNLGLGVTPSAWATANGQKALQITSLTALWTGASGAASLGFNGYESGANSYTYTTTNPATLYQQDGAHKWYTAASGTAGNSITFTQAMTLDASGNLGVGTASVASIFGTTVKVYNAGNGGTLELGGSSVNARLYGSQGLGAGGVGTSTNHPFVFFTNDTERARIDASGNLGLGTASPSYKLDISQSGANAATVDVARVFADATATAESRVLFGSTANAVTAAIGAQTLDATNGALKFYVEGSGTLTERARIPAAGGLVVGTAAIATTATDGFLYVPTCAGTPTGTPTTQTGTAPIVVDTTNNKLYFYSGGSWRDAGP